MGRIRLKISESEGLNRRQNYSQRANEGKMDIIEKKCPYCSHHKAFSNKGKIKCTRCKREGGRLR